MKHNYILTLAILAIAKLSVFAEIPSGYYSKLDGKTNGDLKTAAANAISSHKEITYGKNGTWVAFKETDCRTIDGQDYWWDMYSDNFVPVSTDDGELNTEGLNIEHSVANSWWDGTKNAAYKDLHHLNPADATANNRKSNYPLGVVATVTWENGVTFVGKPDGEAGDADYVYEPHDDYKGDFARIFFYMFTCYENMTWGTRFTWMYTPDETYPMLRPWAYNLLLEWHRQDPVSQKEIDRNEAVYNIQGNRNPFVDIPDLAEYIWGKYVDQTFVLSNYVKDTTTTKSGELTSITSDYVLDFGEVVYGNAAVATLFLQGENLDEAKALELLIYDMDGTDDAAMFRFDGQAKLSVESAEVNSEEGLNVEVTYSPTSLGEHETYLIARRGGLSEAVSIKLHGTCISASTSAVPTAPTALPATDITETSYTANWTAVEGEEIDCYLLNRTKYVDGTAETTTIEVDGTSYVVSDFCGNESYTVQSVRSGVASAESNAISVYPTSITDVERGARFAVSNIVGGVVVNCSEAVARVDVYSPSGQCVKTLVNVVDNDRIHLPHGIYILKAAGFARPIKVVVR